MAEFYCRTTDVTAAITLKATCSHFMTTSKPKKRTHTRPFFILSFFIIYQISKVLQNMISISQLDLATCYGYDQ